MSGQFDFLVIGDSEAAACAAAVAAKAGADVAVLSLRPQKKNAPAPASAAIPNFVWRRLDLQDYDLALEPVTARVTLFADQAPVTTGANARQSVAALGEQGVSDNHLWSEFVEETRALNEPGFLTSTMFGSRAPDGKEFSEMLRSPRALERAAKLFGPCVDLVEDYFQDERLKAHVSAHALSASGFGDHEVGSAAALAEFLGDDAWRVRTAKNTQSLRTVLERVAQDAGVKPLSGQIVSITADSGKYASVTIGTDEKVKVKHIFFATPDEAMIAGAIQSGPGSRRKAEHAQPANVGTSAGFGAGLDQGRRAEFTVRIKLSEPIDPPTDDPDAIFQILDSSNDLQAARDAVINGRMFDQLPVEFEFTENGDILARSAYLPSAFCEDGAWRGWSGQDKQAATTLIKDRLASRLPGLTKLIRGTESEVATPYAGQSPFDGCTNVVVQRRRHNAIGAAVTLIDEVIARG